MAARCLSAAILAFAALTLAGPATAQRAPAADPARPGPYAFEQTQPVEPLDLVANGWRNRTIRTLSLLYNQKDGPYPGSPEAAARAYLVPMLELLRPVPASAIVPVAIGIFGLSDRMVLAVVAFGGLWPTLLATIQGFASVEPRLKDLGAMLGLTRLEVIAKIALPSALPDILAALRLSATIALVLTVIGEMVASRSGLGQWILIAGRTFHAGDIFAGIIVLGVIGYGSASLIAAVERRLLRWRRPQ